MSEEDEIIIGTSKPPVRPKVFGVELVPDVHNWKRWWSMRWIIAGAIAQALPVAWSQLPEDWVGPMPAALKQGLGYFVLIALVAASVSRVTHQRGGNS